MHTHARTHIHTHTHTHTQTHIHTHTLARARIRDSTAEEERRTSTKIRAGKHESVAVGFSRRKSEPLFLSGKLLTKTKAYVIQTAKLP